MWVALPPGAPQRSSTRSPGRGSSTRATSIAARDWAMNAPRGPQRRAVRVERRLEHERLGQLRVAMARQADVAARSASASSHERVRAQRRLGRARCRRPSAPAPRAHRAARTTSVPATRGCECRIAACLGRLVVEQRASSAGPLGRGAAQDGVDEPVPAAPGLPWPARPPPRRPRGRARRRGTAARRGRAAARRAPARRAAPRGAPPASR